MSGRLAMKGCTQGAACLLLLLNAALVSAASDELTDLAARIQFDYYVGDARALQMDVQNLVKLEVDQTQRRARDYYLAYAHWKRAELLSANDKTAARRALDACIDSADRGLAAVPKRGSLARPDAMHAELLAIQGGCLIVLSELSGLTTLSRAAKALAQARALQAANPRVLLVAALHDAAAAKSPVERKAAMSAMITAARAFESHARSIESADWGHAEALARLGQLQLQLGDRLAARDSLERSLVIAPDYVLARSLLKRVTDG